MNRRRLRSRWGEGLAGALALAMAAGGAAATTVTTNAYYASALGSDIAESCKEVEIDSTSGDVSAECNKQGYTDDNIYPVDASYDVDDLVYCKPSSSGLSSSLTFGSGSSTGSSGSTSEDTWTPEGWSVSTSSSGKDYIVSATCKAASVHKNSSSFDLGDTSKGLKNEGGTLKKR